MGIWGSLRSNIRYASGIRGFLRETLTAEEARRLVERQLAVREESFLRIVERGVYGIPASPYRALLLHAGLAYEDVVSLVRDRGVEGALGVLYDAGVYVTQEEFKGRRPIRRGDLEIPVRASDFDNPLLTAHYAASTSGSGGAPSRVFVDFDLLTHDAADVAMLLKAHDLAGRPIASWRVAPPGNDGLRGAFRYAKIGQPLSAWFSPSRLSWNPEGLRAAIFNNYTFLACRLAGKPIVRPRFVPRDRVLEIARWLARQTAAGRPAVLDCNASPGTRVCLAASDHGLDISGTVFRLGGEPYTSAKASVIEAAGAAAIGHYATAETGHLGLACAAPNDIDDMHVLIDKVAMVVREKQVGVTGASVPAMIFTSILTSSPKLMLNVESGDFADVEERECGCLLGEIGLSTHVLRLRSYEKLTSEGVTFLGSDLFELMEEILPRRFGGTPTDYQLVEEEGESGPSRVSMVVSPGVADLDEGALVELVIRTLRSYPQGGRLMAEQWQQGNTLRVVRRDPYATAGTEICHCTSCGRPHRAAAPADCTPCRRFRVWEPDKHGARPLSLAPLSATGFG